jgi:putative transposase
MAMSGLKQARDPLYRRYRFPAEVISYAVWLYFRFPLSQRMVEEMLAARGTDVSHESPATLASRRGLPQCQKWMAAWFIYGGR